MTSEDILIELCGAQAVVTFKEVKHTSMRVARATKTIIAKDLNGTLPKKGKQFLRTERGLFRLAPGDNSDNSTEIAKHAEMGATTVQVFGDVPQDRIDMGVLSLKELYARHGQRLDLRNFLRALDKELG